MVKIPTVCEIDVDAAPCPYCGELKKLYVPFDEDDGFYVICPICNVLGPNDHVALEAVKAWNKRCEGKTTFIKVSVEKEVELVPCPFCGDTTFLRLIPIGPAYAVECSACGDVCGPDGVTEMEAVVAWNNRSKEE